METPELFLAPVPGHDDLLAFRYDFDVIPEGKASDAGVQPQLVTELEDGDLLIAGYAAVFEGDDRMGENFEPGAFTRGLKAFLGGNAPLCFHHKHDHVIGRVLDMHVEPDKGLYMKARVDKQPESSPLRWIYNAVKKGSMRGLSVGGFFKRKLTEAGLRISDMDFTETSVTGVPIHPQTSFAVIAGKALADMEIPSKPSVDGEIRAEDERQITFLIDQLGELFDRIKKRGDGQDTRLATADALL